MVPRLAQVLTILTTTLHRQVVVMITGMELMAIAEEPLTKEVMKLPMLEPLTKTVLHTMPFTN